MAGCILTPDAPKKKGCSVLQLHEFIDDTGILQHMLQIDYQLEHSALLI